MSTTILLGCVLAWPVAPVASTDLDRRVVVAPLAVDGELAEPVRATLSQRLREGLDAEAFDVVAAEQGAARTVRGRVVAHARDLDFTLSLVERDGTTVIATVEEHCDMCGTVEAGDMIASMGMALSRRAELISIERPAPPPPRPVELVDAPEPVPQRRPVRWALGWSAVAAGIVGSASGAALLALDGRPIQRKCSGGNVDHDGTCRFAHSTLVPGAVITTLGVGLVATGIALVVVEKRRAKQLSRARPSSSRRSGSARR